MKPQECRHFENCSSPICPIDGFHGEWFPDEPICASREFCHDRCIMAQKKIKRMCQSLHGFFTFDMLMRDCIIGRAIEGLDPDICLKDTSKNVKEWLKKHPEKKTKSKEQIEALTNRFGMSQNTSKSTEKIKTVAEKRKTDLNLLNQFKTGASKTIQDANPSTRPLVSHIL